MTQQRAMLIFSIGPVQSLIAQARKTRDLWLGSYLLAKLMEAAMENPRQYNGEFVFPTIQTVDGYVPDLPNKYIALFPTMEEAILAADQSKRDMERRWNIIAKQVQDRVFFYNAWLLMDEVKGIWNRQTSFESFFEIYWIAEPEPTENELERAKPERERLTRYKLWLERAQATFDARKRLRDFQWQDEPGEKSTISGDREVLHGPMPQQSGSSREATRLFWRRLAGSHPVKDIYHDGSERLDAIDTVKRFALYSSVLQPVKRVEATSEEHVLELLKMDFPSTSSIATASFVKLLFEKSQQEQNQELIAAIDEWITLTSPGELVKVQPHAIPYLFALAEQHPQQTKLQDILRRDGDCFFEETFVPEALKKMYPEAAEKIESAEVIRAIKNLRRAVGAQPTPYYALIQMDGDHMGTIINSVTEQEKHKAISGALSDFARNQVPRIVQEEHPGRLVYAGGDDVFAFSPLIGLLTMVNTLQECYKEIVRQPVADDMKKEVTVSMGIAIAHHFTPLSLVRQAASEAEQLAKHRYERNALVVTVLRRSGEQTRVGCRWQYEYTKDQPYAQQPIPLFQEFYRRFIEEKLSVSSIHTLLDEAPALVGLEVDAQQSEIKRVLQRQRKNDTVLPDQKATELAWAVVHLAQAMNTAMDGQHNEDTVKAISLHEDTQREGLIEVFGWLLVMAFLAREEHSLEPAELAQKEEVNNQ